MFPLGHLYLISEWTIRLIMLLHIPQNRTPAAARTWLLVVFLLPWPGLALYLLLGSARLPKQRRQAQERASEMIRAAQSQFERTQFIAEPNLSPNLAPAAKLALALGDFEPFGGNRFELLDHYEDSIDRLIADVDAATQHVHLLYYIWEPDATGQRLADACLRAAIRGVSVRVLMDGVGGKRGLRQLGPKLQAGGITVHAMLQVHPLLLLPGATRFDLRNHRKIAVLDGKIGYTGSQNIVNAEFVKSKPNEELVIRITGPLVSQLQAVFLADQYFETGQPMQEPSFFPDHDDDDRGSIAQLLPSGPGYSNENGQEVVVALIHGAQQRVVITTPYLIPDEPVLQALRSACHRGVDVRLIVSQSSNQMITELAQQSFYEELLSCGIKIHRYRPHFLHAKHVSIDDGIAIIGTANMDIRSFKLNAEVVAIIYDAGVVARLKQVQEKYLADSETLTAESWEKRPTWRRLAQNVARMADALL